MTPRLRRSRDIHDAASKHLTNYTGNRCENLHPLAHLDTLAMDQYRLVLPFLKHTMHFEKGLSQHSSSRSQLGASTEQNIMESRLMLQFLEAEAALEELRAAQADALRASLSHQRRSLRSSLGGLRITTQLPTMYHPTSHHLVDSNSIIRDNIISSTVRAEKALWQSLPHSLLRCTTSDAASHHHTLYHSGTEEHFVDSPFKMQHSYQPVVPTQQRRKKPKQCWDVSISFPSKLFNVLEVAETEGHSDIVSFQPDGKSFMIHEPDKFAQEVLARYFRTKRLSSFQKQLSLYGFKRIQKGPDMGAIRHEFFQRDNKKLVAKIIRKKQGVPVDT